MKSALFKEIILGLLSTTQLFIKNDTLDIGAFYLTIPILKTKEDTLLKEYKFANKLGIPNSILTFRKEISLGDEVYFIGFPLGIGTFNQVEPLIRSGSIARDR